MDFIIELVLEIVIDGTIELSSNKKVPSIIRYPLIAIITVLTIGIIIVMLLAGILFLKESIIIGIILMVIAIALIISLIVKSRKIYLEKKKNKIIKI